MAERGERGERGTSVYAHPYCAEIDRRVRAGEDLRTIAHWLEGCPDDVPRVPLRMLLRYRQHLSDGAKGWASRPGSAHEGARRSIDVEGKQRKLLALLERQLTEAEHDSWRGGPRGPSVGLIRACVGLLRHWQGAQDRDDQRVPGRPEHPLLQFLSPSEAAMFRRLQEDIAAGRINQLELYKAAAPIFAVEQRLYNAQMRRTAAQ